MEFLLFVAFITLIISHFSLRNRVDELERKTRFLDYQTTAQTEAKKFTFSPEQPGVIPEAKIAFKEEVSFSPVQSRIPIPIPPPTPFSPQVAEPAGEFFLYAWFREQTLIKIGSIIFFLGAVWFVSYAIEQNWISPFMRILLGMLLAVAIYIVGAWRRTIEQVQYQVLTTLGTGVFLGTVIASQFAFIVPVLHPSLAFILMLGSIGYTLSVALKTKTEWLGVAAGVAGLFAPLLVRFTEPFSGLLLTYVLLLSVGFVVVVFFTAWRVIPLTLVAGSTLYLSLVYDAASLSTNVLWFFVVVFSLLFCASTAINIWRTNDPDLFDVSVLAITTIQFMLYADEIALLPDLALFVAAAVTGFVGYFLRQKGVAANGVSVFVAISLMFSLVGTAELLDGFVLTIAYAAEALAIYLLSLRLATVKRSVVVAALLFVLPVVAGMADLSHLAWENSILRVELLGVLSVIFTLGFAVVFTLRSEALQAIDWLRQTAGGLFTVWYLFTLAASLVMGGTQTVFTEGFVTTMLLSVLAGVVILYILQVIPRSSWQGGALLTLIAPTISAIALLGDQAWSAGLLQQSFLGALFYFLCLVTIVVLYWSEARRVGEGSATGKYAYGLLWLIIVYGFLFLATIWDSLLFGEAERVVTAVSYTFFIYLIANVLMLARVGAHRLLPVLLVLVVPGVLMLESLAFLGWSEGLLSIDAVGLYVTTTVLFLLGTTLREYRQYVAEEEREALRLSALFLYGVAGMLVFALVWVMSHTIFLDSTVAVTASLFVYTVSGLFAYSRGRETGSKVWRRIGVLLLATVILRLALVDVWGMDLVWRIVTFLGIGLLFIITALVERAQIKD
ncbi:MAG: DUF2339 domain-containing protein [Candidatus Pacebacteria bacterium]|nr:DUF2339 domain-containing protein [Candidatus Paceibacterota bacterium]